MHPQEEDGGGIDAGGATLILIVPALVSPRLISGLAGPIVAIFQVSLRFLQVVYRFLLVLHWFL